MSVLDLLTRPCTILVATAPADDYDQTPGTPVEVETVCELQQVQSLERGEGAIQQTGWRVVLPGHIAVQGGDAIVIDGARYEFDGDPWPVWNPRTRSVSHVEVPVRRAG